MWRRAPRRLPGSPAMPCRARATAGRGEGSRPRGLLGAPLRSASARTSQARFRWPGHGKRLNRVGPSVSLKPVGPGEAEACCRSPFAERLSRALSVWIDSPHRACLQFGFRHFPISAWSALGLGRGTAEINTCSSPSQRLREPAGPGARPAGGVSAPRPHSWSVSPRRCVSRMIDATSSVYPCEPRSSRRHMGMYGAGLAVPL